MDKDVQTKIENLLAACQDRVADKEPLTARDWSAFFASLLSVVKELLPIILPLFLEPKPSDEKKA